MQTRNKRNSKDRKTMKYFNIILASGLLSVAVCSLSSCADFLDEESQTALTEEKIYSDLTYTESNIQSIYKTWRGLFTDRYLWEQMIGTDEIQSGAYQALKEDNGKRGALDMYNSLLNSELSYTREQWENRWPKISEAAKIVYSLDDGNVEAGTDKAHLLGEASFLRGGLTMELAMLFGRIPIIDMNRIDELGYGRQPLADVWAFIINDFETAAKYCPETNEPGRATRYAASMLLGYAYMAAPEETGLRDFSKAKSALETVVNGPFRLVDYWDLWDYSITNSAEAIFEWQFNNTYPDNNMVQFQLGSRAVQSMGGDGCFISGYDAAVPTEWAYSDVADGGIWEDGDIRKEEAIRYDFTWYGQTPNLNSISWEDIGDDHDELKPHIKKYEDFRTDSHSGLGINNMWYSGKDIPFLRLANAILLYAECLNELGETSAAVAQVNKVRARAWENDLPADKAWSTSMSQETFRTEIMTERVRELFGERWRKFDLIRTGHFYDYVKARNKWAARSGTIADYNVLWPIPQTEIDQNDDITQDDQNEGYR